MKKKVEIINKSRVYDGFFKMDRYTIRHGTPDGGMSGEITRELFERGNAAAVLVYDPDEDLILLVEEFRIGNLGAGMIDAAAWSLAPIAGMVEPGEDSLTCVLREAYEEAGIKLHAPSVKGPWRYMSSPGGTSEILDIFIAEADLSLYEPRPRGHDADEFTQPTLFRRGEVMTMLARGIVPASLMVAMLWLDRELSARGYNHGA